MSQRIQRKRIKGWKMPENTVYVGRPSKWGNPYRVVFYNGLWRVKSPELHFYLSFESEDRARHHAVSLFEQYASQLQGIEELRGKDLACWCRLDEPCHADVLLELLSKMDL
jgi:hypothetical protein